jgi:hypothetical protein
MAYGQGHKGWFRSIITEPNKALHPTAIPLRFIAAGELGRRSQLQPAGVYKRGWVGSATRQEGAKGSLFSLPFVFRAADRYRRDVSACGCFASATRRSLSALAKIVEPSPFANRARCCYNPPEAPLGSSRVSSSPWYMHISTGGVVIFPTPSLGTAALAEGKYGDGSRAGVVLGLTCLPVKQEIAGSNPVAPANNIQGLTNLGVGDAEEIILLCQAG